LYDPATTYKSPVKKTLKKAAILLKNRGIAWENEYNDDLRGV